MKKLKVCIAFIFAIVLTSCVNPTVVDKSSDIIDNIDNDVAMITSYKGADQVAITDTGIYYTENYLLNFYDHETGIRTPLCQNSVCEHKDDTCTDKMESSLSRIFLNYTKDKLFYNYIDETTNQHITVMQELDGSNKKIIDKRITSAETFLRIAADKNSIYVIGNNIVENENSYISSKANLIKIDYSTGINEVVYEFDNNQAKIIGAYDRNIIVEVNTYDSYTSDITYDILSIDIDSGSSELIETYEYKMTNDSVPNEFAFVKDKFLYKFTNISQNTASLYKTDLSTNEQTLVGDNLPYYGNLDSTSVKGSVSDSIILDMRRFKRNGASEDKMGRYTINLNDGSYKEIKLNMVRETVDEEIIFDPINIYEQYKDFLIVSYGIDYVDYIFAGQNTAAKIGVPKYGLISVDDFFNSVENYEPLRYID